MVLKTTKKNRSVLNETKKMKELLPCILVAPVLLFITILLLIPIGRGIVTSFFDPPGLKPSLGHFVGFSNYGKLFEDPRFWNSLKITLTYTFNCLIGAVGLGMVTALLLNSKFKGEVLSAC